jgi:phage minor structural protein
LEVQGLIYLKDGNTPLNEAWADEIYQEGNSTYQLTFKYPFSSDKWKLLTEETELIADDLHGEQEFTIFEVVKEQGYITVYANQIATLLKYHSISSINVDRVAGNVVMTELAGAILRDCPFSFYSDITEKHTFNAANISVMDALIKEKHSIVGQWGGDLVRDKYQVSLLKNGGSETEALFMYKKNMRSPQQTTSTKELRTRIHFRKKIEVGEGDNRKEQWLRVTVDSPLISKYKHIYEDDMEVTDEDVKDLASLTKYGEQYYRTTLCDMIEDSLELDVAGVGDVPVKIFDVVSVYHEQFEIDVRKKITKYRYSPMGKRLKSVGFGTIQQTLGGALSALVSDSVKAETAIIEQDFEVKLEKELKNADKVFDQKMNQMEQSLSDEIEQARAKAEEVKAAMTEQLNLKINQNKSEVTEQLKSDFDRKLSNAQNELAGVRANLTQAQSQLSGDIGQIRSDVGIIRAKQGEAESELTKQVQALNQTKAELAGVKTNLTQAQSQLTSNIAQIRSDVGNIRTKQSQAEADLAKQVSALNQTKTELAGVKSAQANYEQTTTRRLAELANVADGKASKSELVQTAEELKSRIASVQASGRNLFLNSLFKQDIRKTGIWTTSTYTATIDSESKYLGHNALKIVGQDPTGRDGNNPKITYPATGQYGKVAPGSMTNQDVTISFYAKAEKAGTILRSRLGNIGFKDGNVTLTTEVKRYVVKFSMAWTGLSNLTTNEWLFNLNRADTVWIWMPKFEVSDTDTPYSEAPEDIENQISAVESSFKQKADSLEAGVNRLTEGLKTKADSSALNLLSDSIKQSVKSLETDTQNKLSQKLSTAEFEVQASGIRQEILNATKDKADKTLVTAEAGKLREELASLQVGGRNLLKGSKGPFKPNRNPSNFDNNVLYHNETSIYMVNGQRYRISAKTDGTFTSHHDGFKESDNVVLWIMDKAVTNYQIVSDAKTGTTGTEFVWSRPTGTYHLRVNTYRKDPQKLKSVWEAKVEQGSFKTDWSPAPEDTDGLITEAKAVFERTAQGLRVDLTAVQAYVSTDSTRAEALRTYSREETARQLTAERKLIDASYVGKAQHTEDVKGISRRFEELNSGGPNLVSNGATELGLKNWLANGKLTADHKHPFFKNGTATMFVLDTTEATIVFMQQNQYNVLKRNTDYTLSFTAFASSNVSGFRALVGLLSNTDHAWKKTLHTYTKSLSPTQAERITVQFNSGDYDGFALRFDNMGSSNGRSATVWISEIDVYEGAMKRPYQPSPVNGQSYADTKLAEYKQGIDGQLANVQSALNTANGSLTSFNTWKQSAQETLNKVGRVETGLNETKTSLAEFKQTAQGLRTDLSAVQAYVNTDGSRAEALRTFSREETARQMTALRQSVEAGYVAKAQHTEDVRGLTRRFEELKSSSETKLAEFRQGIDGQFATISSQISETIKKTDISITPGQITLGTGKVVNGQTLASLFVQNPESMEAITKLMRITGDLIVDGSITGRDLAAGAITTPHLAAGAVTAEVLGANAVTADKVKADDALLEKLSAGEALLRKLMAKDAFINRLQSIDFTAEQIKGGLLRSIDGSLIFDLNKNTLTMSSNTAAIKRVLPGHPTQFMRYETERKGNVDYTRTIIGSNRNGSEKFDSVTFAGLVVENSNKAGIEDSLRLYGDNTYFRHAQGEVGWNINAVTQRMAPATWQKESAIWARNFVVPKHRTPNGRDWVKLEETVAALWRLWEHAAGNQVTMTGAMRDKVRELFQNYGYNYGIS